MKINDQLSIKLRAKTFYFASIFLPRNTRKDIESLYTFCRYLDDIGDEKNIKKKESIKKLNEIKNDIKKKKTKSLIVSNFINLQKRYKINNQIVFHLIEGIKSDLYESVNIKDDKQLFIYCYSVAGTVGFMFCKIINVTDKELYLRAIQLGIGMQRTNISRDIKEDLELNRIYLPKTKRKFKGEKKKILENKFLRLSLSHDLKVFLHETDQYYLNSWEGIKKLPLKYSLSVAIAAELYQRIGFKIIKNNCNIWETRIHLKLLEKIFYSFIAIFKLVFSKRNIDENIDNKCNILLKKLKIL